MKDKVYIILGIVMALSFLLSLFDIIPWLIGMGIIFVLMVILNVLDGDNLFVAIIKAIFSDDNTTSSDDTSNNELPDASSILEKQIGYKSSDKLGAMDALLGSYCSKCKFYDENMFRCDKFGKPTDRFSTCNWYES